MYNGGESSGGTPRGGNSLELQREEEGDGESENGKNKGNRTFRWVSFFFLSFFLVFMVLLHMLGSCSDPVLGFNITVVDKDNG